MGRYRIVVWLGHTYSTSSQWPCVLCFSARSCTSATWKCPNGFQYDMWFQNNGVPAYLGAQTQQHLNTHFPGTWLRHGGPVSRPARLSDLNFIIWGDLNELIYRDQSSNMEDIAEKLHAAMVTTDADILWQAQARIPWCASTCWGMQGGHFEHVML
jgi:hypothetical protein